jgi:hypothetical protein
MLQSYYPIYKITLDLQALRSRAELRKGSARHRSELSPSDTKHFQALLQAIYQTCLDFDLTGTSEMARRLIERPAPEAFAEPQNYADVFSDLNHLDGSLSYELGKEAVFRIPPVRKEYFEQKNLFGRKVSIAFPSCKRDIEKAGSCYALEQEDACVHHLMLVLERGLNTLAVKVGVPYHHSSWQTVITNIDTKTKTLPRGPDLDFYREVNAQFGFLKVAYRNHSEHVGSCW